jgi:hypothetical protein
MFRYSSIVFELFPRMEPEIKGIAEGAGCTVEYAFFAAFRDGLNLKAYLVGHKADESAEDGLGESGGGGPSCVQDGNCTAFWTAGSAQSPGGLLGQTKDTTSNAERYRIFQIRSACLPL